MFSNILYLAVLPLILNFLVKTITRKISIQNGEIKFKSKNIDKVDKVNKIDKVIDDLDKRKVESFFTKPEKLPTPSSSSWPKHIKTDWKRANDIIMAIGRKRHCSRSVGEVEIIEGRLKIRASCNTYKSDDRYHYSSCSTRDKYYTIQRVYIEDTLTGTEFVWSNDWVRDGPWVKAFHDLLDRFELEAEMVEMEQSIDYDLAKEQRDRDKQNTITAFYETWS